MGGRRFTRLTNGFSKKLDNHVAAVALYVAHYNLCRTHEALRTSTSAQDLAKKPLLQPWPVLNLRVARQDQEKSRPGATPDGFLMRLPARHCSGSAASVPNAEATWLTQS
jgi:hypothetical protein